MEMFREVLEECDLFDVGYSERWYTWERGNFTETNIRERLDRGVTNVAWLEFFSNASIRLLSHSFFYQCPLMITVDSKDV